MPNTSTPPLELTVRAILMGSVLGTMMTAINTYLGLQTGWGIGGALIATILGFAFFKVVPTRDPYTPLENNITQTTASAAGSMTHAVGSIALLPALKWLGHPLSLTGMFVWGYSVAFLGAFFAAPIRHQMIEIENLRFPTGTAAAETIKAMHAQNENSTQKAKVLLLVALVAGVYTLASYFLPILKQPTVFEWLGLGGLTVMGFQLLMSPIMAGAGILIGPQVTLSLLLGAIISWGLIATHLTNAHWVTGPVFDYKQGTAGWLIWPGVTLMVTDSLTTLAVQLPHLIKNQLRATQQYNRRMQLNPRRAIPTHWWVSGLVISSVACMITLKTFFQIPYYLTLIAIALTWIMSIIAARAGGETGINPLTAVGKLTQLSFGVIAPGQTITNLMSAGVAAAGAASAADMLEDWKTGKLLGACPKAQLIAQLFGTGVGVSAAIGVYCLFDHAYSIGDITLPAPSARAWKAMSELLSGGLTKLPAHVDIAVIISALMGIGGALGRQTAYLKNKLPSGLAMGIGFIVPPMYSMTMFLGCLIGLLWQWRKPALAEQLSFSVASGLIVGEGLTGIVVAILSLLHVPKLV